MNLCLSWHFIGSSLLTLWALSCGGNASAGERQKPDLLEQAKAEVRRSELARANSLPKHALTLQQAIDLAFERNPSLQAAAERYGVAQAKVEEAVAAFYPRVTARVAYNYTDNPAEAFSYIVSQRRFTESNFADINQPGWVENFRPEVIGSWSLFRGGQDYYRKKAAELGVEQAELERSALHNHLAAAVTSAYYALAISPRQVQVAQRSIASVESELAQARTRYQEGTGLKSDVLSLEVRLAEAREAEVKATNAIELARSGLVTLIGGNDGRPVDAVGTDAAPPEAVAADVAKALQEARAQRPEVQAAEHLVELRRHELESERGARLPRVNAFVAYGQNSRTPSFSTSRQNTSIGINAELDLFAGGAVSARIEAAERRVAEAEAERERNRLEVENEVRQAHISLKEALERIKVTHAALRSAEEALRLVHEQYQGGTSTVTRYLEAETARADANTRALAARYQAFVAEANLKKATGFWH
ncbi:MAG: TolC family protein [Methylotetracoccus sp.]|nr:TolC family protein [Methylotetracoccus sp.]